MCGKSHAARQTRVYPSAQTTNTPTTWSRSTLHGDNIINQALSWISPLRGFKKIRTKYGNIAHYILTIMDIADVKIYTIIVPYSYSIHTHISSTIGFTNNSWAY